MNLYKYNFPTDIRFGAGARKILGTELKARGVKRPLIVTDRDVAKLPFTAEIEGILRDAGLETATFAGIWGNPLKSQAEAGVEAGKKHRCDGIVALGGGAAMDVAKLVALMQHHPGDLYDYEDGKPGALPVDKELPYVVALPTTAGTGSEVGRSAVVSDDVTKIKKIIFDPRLLPRLVLADPELTLKLPAKVTATTGMDALTHLVESYLAKGFQPLCDGIALEGVRLVRKSLVKCVLYANHPGSDAKEHLEARGLMLNASLMGAVAFQKGLGVTHSCAHALSTVCDLHHGLANGIMINHAMAFNLPSEPERFRELAIAAGTREATGQSFIQWLETLKAEIGIPATLTEAGVPRAKLKELVDVAVSDPCHGSNPRPCTRADIQAIFEKAF